MPPVTTSHPRRRRRAPWLALAVALALLPVAVPAQETKGLSAEDIVKGLLPPEEEVETRGIQTRSIGPLRPAPRPGPSPTASAGGRIAVPIQFKYDSAEITPGSFDQLVAMAEALRSPRLQGIRVRVEGHTDSQGADGYNQALSQRRAEAVRRFLVEKGAVLASRLEARGYGKSQPLPDVPQDTEEGRARNRRVELVNLGTEAAVPAPPPLTVSVVVTYERDGETLTLSPGGVLTRSDSYRVTFTPSDAGHVHVYQIDATGRVQAIFPNPDFSKATNPVKAGQAYSVPGKGQWFGLEGTPGDEEIVVVAARTEVSDPAAIAVGRQGPAVTVLTRGPAPRARADVAPEPASGVFAYRLPFRHR